MENLICHLELKRKTGKNYIKSYKRKLNIFFFFFQIPTSKRRWLAKLGNFVSFFKNNNNSMRCLNDVQVELQFVIRLQSTKVTFVGMLHIVIPHMNRVD